MIPHLVQLAAIIFDVMKELMMMRGAKIWHTKTKGETLPMGNFIVALLTEYGYMAGGFECGTTKAHYYFCYSCMHEVKAPSELLSDSRKTVFLFLSQFLYQRELQFPSLVCFSM